MRDPCMGAFEAGAVCFVILLLCVEFCFVAHVAQSELDSGTAAAGRNKHNDFFRVVAEFRTL